MIHFTDWQRLRDIAPQYVETAADIALRLCAIPAPNHHEQQRGEFICALFAERGYGAAVERDDVGNVYVRRGNNPSHPALLLLAHMDTVFPLDTPLNISRSGSILRGPSIGDNCLSVAGMFMLLDMLDALKIETARDIIFCSNVGEEGLGNLRGAWAAVNRYRPNLSGVIAIDGDFGRIMHDAVGSRRFEVTVSGPGGHSYGAFGTPSAIHGLARGIAAVADVVVPATPKTTFNVGTINGGTSVNTIAASATAIVDVRSEDADRLVSTADHIMTLFRSHAGSGLVVDINIVGDRPAGRSDANHPLVRAAADAITWLGRTPIVQASSTDANVPIGLGIPAICIGVSQSKGAHTVDEFTDIAQLDQGLAQLARVVIAAATQF